MNIQVELDARHSGLTSAARAPSRPAAAYDELLARVLPEARAQRRWQPADGPLPALFVSHGAPPVLDSPEWLSDLNGWARAMPKPRGVVVVSAHWQNAPLAVSGTAAGTPLYYDFGGFHPHYYALRYPTPDAGGLARRVRGALSAASPVHQWRDRGLDHGAFVPLMAMYPAADVPVVQLSMPSDDPGQLLRLGARLAALRDEGVLVVGSGFLTHSRGAMGDPDRLRQVVDFDDWAADALARGDVDALLDYRNRAPAVDVVHPTADHWVPLLLALGAADDPATARTAFRRFALGNSTRSVEVA